MAPLRAGRSPNDARSVSRATIRELNVRSCTYRAAAMATKKKTAIGLLTSEALAQSSCFYDCHSDWTAHCLLQPIPVGYRRRKFN